MAIVMGETPAIQEVVMIRRCLVLCLAVTCLQAAPLQIAKTGKGPGILLIHGLGGNKEVWAATAAELSRDHTVVCVDLPGSGGTPGPVVVDGRADLRAVGKALAALVRREGLVPCLVVGHSMGAPIGALTILEDPTAFRGLVLADGFLGALPAELLDPMIVALMTDSRGALKAWFGDEVTSQAQFERVYAECLRVPVPTFQAYGRSLTRDPLQGRRGDLKLPMLMVAAGPAAADPAKAPDYLAFLGLTGLPNLRVVNFPKAKHWVMWDMPEEFLIAVRAFEAGLGR